MGRRNQVDVVRPFVLESEHPRSKVFYAHFAADEELADRVILAKDTLQGTTGKKYGSGATGPRNRRFFPWVQVYRGNPWQAPDTTITRFSALSVNAADARAKIASLKLCIEGFGPA
jgi:hypothetical protein